MPPRYSAAASTVCAIAYTSRPLKFPHVCCPHIVCTVEGMDTAPPRASDSPKDNQLLSCLRPITRRCCRIWSGYRCRSARRCTSPAARCGHVYFPTTAIVSLLYVLEDGASAEIAVVGNEGMVGISLFMGGETTPSRAVVQSAGLRLPAQGAAAEGGVQPRRPDAAPAAALHPGADHADGADRGVQPAPFGRPAIVPLAAAEPRPAVRRTSSR